MPRYIDATPKYTDSSNEPLPNGLLYFFESGTNTQKTTYADVNQTIANPHPLVLNGDGSVPNCFYSGSAKVILADENDVQIWERDPVVGAESSSFGDAWDSISVYGLNEVVTFNDLLYTSITENNQNNNPASVAAAWSQFDLVTRWNVNETYQSRDPVIGTDSNIYLSLINNNLGIDPTTDGGVNWQATGSGSSATTPFTDWDNSLDYGEGVNNIVEGSDGNYYISITTPNLNQDPTSEPLFWKQVDFVETGAQTFDGVKTFNNTISGSIDGNAATATTATTATDCSRSVVAGTGLTGGGQLNADRTLNVAGGDGITANANDIEVDSTVVRTSGSQTIAGNKTFSGTVDIDNGKQKVGSFTLVARARIIAGVIVGDGLTATAPIGNVMTVTMPALSNYLSSFHSITGQNTSTNDPMDASLAFISSTQFNIKVFNADGTVANANNQIVYLEIWDFV